MNNDLGWGRNWGVYGVYGDAASTPRIQWLSSSFPWPQAMDVNSVFHTVVGDTT